MQASSVCFIPPASTTPAAKVMEQGAPSEQRMVAQHSAFPSVSGAYYLGMELGPDRSPLLDPHHHSSLGPSHFKILRVESGLHSPSIAQKIIRSYELPRDREFINFQMLKTLLNQSTINTIKVSTLLQLLLPYFILLWLVFLYFAQSLILCS